MKEDDSEKKILFRVECYDGLRLFVRARWEDEAKSIASSLQECKGHTIRSALCVEDAEYYDEIEEYNREINH